MTHGRRFFETGGLGSLEIPGEGSLWPLEDCCGGEVVGDCWRGEPLATWRDPYRRGPLLLEIIGERGTHIPTSMNSMNNQRWYYLEKFLCLIYH